MTEAVTMTIPSPRCLRGNIESSSITSLQNSLRRMHLDASCRGLLHHMPKEYPRSPFFHEDLVRICTNPAER